MKPLCTHHVLQRHPNKENRWEPVGSLFCEQPLDDNAVHEELKRFLVNNGINPTTETLTKYRAVLAPFDLMDVCEFVLESLERNLTDDCLPATKALLTAAIASEKESKT